MKRRFFALPALVLSLALLTGCFQSGETAAASADTASEQEASTSITLATRSTQELFYLPFASQLGVNPYTTQSRTNTTFLPLVYEGLFTVTPDFTADPTLCQSYTVSEDGMTYTLTLRQGVFFQSGNALTVQDVASSLNYARSCDAYAQRLSCIRSVEVSGAEIVIRLDQARDQLPLLLDVPIVRAGTETQALPDGTGPYVLVLQGEGENYLDGRADWWGGRELPASRIYLLDCDSAVQVRDAFEYGRISLSCTDPNGEVNIPYHSDCEQWIMASTELLYLGFNHTSGPFAKDEVCQAVTYAIDRDRLAAQVGSGYLTPVTLPAHPASPVYNASLALDFQQDLDTAGELLSQTGWKDMNRDGLLEQQEDDGWQTVSAAMIVSTACQSEVEGARLLAEDLTELGLEITVLALDETDYQTRKQNLNYDLFYESIRLTPDFDLEYLLRQLGLMDSYTSSLCARAAENTGNYYDLHEYLLLSGGFCPVAVKDYAVYTQRGQAAGLNPAPYNPFYNLTGLELMADKDETRP